MIPKIAHFHWTGPPMSWLRSISILSFKRLNPGWEIRIHDTPEDIRKHSLQYAQEGDWTRWRILNRYGGFSVASDIVFVKPIPDEWLRCGLNACLDGSRGIFQMAMVGARPEHPFIAQAAILCETMPKSEKMGYQDFGPNLLQEMGRKLLHSQGKFYDQKMDALCFFRHEDVECIWEEPEWSLPEEVIGIHWYGEHPRSKIEEASITPESSSWIARLAAGVMG